MPKYLVTWEIDSEADTPREAAIEAWRMKYNSTTTASVFKVKNVETGKVTRHDLLRFSKENHPDGRHMLDPSKK